MIELPKIPGRVGKESICYYCKHAYPNKDACSWALRRIPVPGWDSIDTVRYRGNGEKYMAHKVQNCPQFEKG